MARLTGLLIAAALLMAPSESGADTWKAFGERSYADAEGRWVATLAAARGEVRWTLAERTAEGERVLGSGALRPPPLDVHVLGDGAGLVLLDTYGPGAGEGTLVRRVGPEGTPFFSVGIQQIFDSDVRAGFPRSVSSTWWRRLAWVDEASGLVALVAAGPGVAAALGGPGLGSATFTGARPDRAPAGSEAARDLERRRLRAVRVADGAVVDLEPSVLLDRLRGSEDDSERAILVELLGLRPDPEVERRLRGLLRDRTLGDRAAVALADLGDDRWAARRLPRAAASRKRALGDRAFALLHLGRFAPPRKALAAYVEVLDDDANPLRGAAAEGLTRLGAGHPELESELVALLRDPEASDALVAAAASALAGGEGTEGLQALGETVRDSTERRPAGAAVSALRDRGTPGAQLLLRLLDEGTAWDRHVAGALPRGLPAEALPILAAALLRGREDPALRRSLLTAVADTGLSAAAPLLVDAFEDSRDLNEARGTSAAMEDLGFHGVQAAIALLARGTPFDLALQESVRRDASEEHLAAVTALVDRALARPDEPRARSLRLAVDVLARFGGPAAVSALERLASAGPDSVPVRSIDALAAFESDPADASLARLLAAGNPAEDRLIRHFTRRSHPAATATLQRMFKDAGPPPGRLCDALLRAAEEGDPGVLPAMRAWTRARDEGLRSSATGCLLRWERRATPPPD